MSYKILVTTIINREGAVAADTTELEFPSQADARFAVHAINNQDGPSMPIGVSFRQRAVALNFTLSY
jgi:hypothetical protein